MRSLTPLPDTGDATLVRGRKIARTKIFENANSLFCYLVSLNFFACVCFFFGHVAIGGVGLVWFGLVWFGLVWFGLGGGILKSETKDGFLVLALPPKKPSHLSPPPLEVIRAIGKKRRRPFCDSFC